MDVKIVNKSHEHKFSAPILSMILANRQAPNPRLDEEGGEVWDVKWKIYVTDEKIKLIRKVLYSA